MEVVPHLTHSRPERILHPSLCHAIHASFSFEVFHLLPLLHFVLCNLEEKSQVVRQGWATVSGENERREQEEFFTGSCRLQVVYPCLSMSLSFFPSFHLDSMTEHIDAPSLFLFLALWLCMSWILCDSPWFSKRREGREEQMDEEKRHKVKGRRHQGVWRTPFFVTLRVLVWEVFFQLMRQ